MSHQRTLRELFHGALKGMFFAERKILDALPKMANAAHSGELRAAFEKHEIESREHVIRLREVFRELGETPHEKYCSGLVGAIQDGQEIALAYKGTQALDAALIAMAQAVEHYEIARYGTLRTWAEQLGLPQSVELLDATLEEEKETDQKLTELAQSEANPRADTVYRVVRRVEPDVDGPAIDDEGELAIEERESDLENQAEEKGRRRVLGRDALGRKAQRDRALRADHP